MIELKSGRDDQHRRSRHGDGRATVDESDLMRSSTHERIERQGPSLESGSRFGVPKLTDESCAIFSGNLKHTHTHTPLGQLN